MPETLKGILFLDLSQGPEYFWLEEYNYLFIKENLPAERKLQIIEIILEMTEPQEQAAV